MWRDTRCALRRGWPMVAALMLVPMLATLEACGLAPNGLLAATPTPARCDPATQWRAPAGNVALDDLAMVGPGEGWAVGALTRTPGDPASAPTGVIYHLTQGQWRRLPQTYPGAELSTISMDSPDDGWAASNSAITGQDDRALVLHYTGGEWRQVDIPALDRALKGPPGTSGGSMQWISVQMFGPDAGWMFAWTNVPRDAKARSGNVILRYVTGVWTPVPAPKVKDTTDLFSLSAVSGDEAWISATDYGDMGDLTTLFAHYVNGAWSIWPQTFPGVTERMTMISPSAGWAFGSDANGNTAALRYDGSTWSWAPLPTDWVARRVLLLSWVFPMSDGAVWFPATQVPSDAIFLVSYAGGQWRNVSWPYPDTLPERLFPDASGELWGIGDIGHRVGCAHITGIQQGVFLHYQQGRWSRDVLP
jgi:hypothetical protein